MQLSYTLGSPGEKVGLQLSCGLAVW